MIKHARKYDSLNWYVMRQTLCNLCFPSFFVAAQVHSSGISYTTICTSFVEWVCFTPNEIIIMTNMFRPWFLYWHSCIYDWRQHDSLSGWIPVYISVLDIVCQRIIFQTIMHCKWYVMVAYCFWNMHTF